MCYMRYDATVRPDCGLQTATLDSVTSVSVLTTMVNSSTQQYATKNVAYACCLMICLYIYAANPYHTTSLKKVVIGSLAEIDKQLSVFESARIRSRKKSRAIKYVMLIKTLTQTT